MNDHKYACRRRQVSEFFTLSFSLFHLEGIHFSDESGKDDRKINESEKRI